jgi:hypothetical protein
MTDDDYIPRGPRERRLTAKPRQRDKAPPVRKPPKPRPEKSELHRQIERVFNGDYSGSALGRRLGGIVSRCNSAQRAVARRMLYALEAQGAMLLSSDAATAGVVMLARFSHAFLRKPDRFIATGATPEEQLRRLANHLLERWSVPSWLEAVWLGDLPREQAWFVHLGSGENLRTAPDLPFPMSKRMAHFAVNAPRGLTPSQALRWGQCRSMDIPEELCGELVNTRLSHPLPDEPFWKTVLQWFSIYPEAFGHASTIIDYIFAQRIGDFAPARVDGWKIAGRAPDRLLAEARHWHAELNRRRQMIRHFAPIWNSCGIPGLTPKPADPSAPTKKTAPAKNAASAWCIEELLSIDQLEIEGARLHHCVASYGPLASSGRCAIYSLRRNNGNEQSSSVTIEVRPGQMMIVQARSLQNAEPAEKDRLLIEFWAKQTGLQFAPGVFATARLRRH